MDMFAVITGSVAFGRRVAVIHFDACEEKVVRGLLCDMNIPIRERVFNL